MRVDLSSIKVNSFRHGIDELGSAFKCGEKPIYGRYTAYLRDYDAREWQQSSSTKVTFVTAADIGHD